MADINTVYFARTNFRGQERVFGIKTPDRRQHTYVVGKTGTGKTNLIKNMAIQDVYAGHGLCVVDPHGELVEEILGKIPASRIKDVIYFNPSDTEYPLGFNVLEVPDKKYKHLIAQGLIGIFTKIWANVWSARMEYILQNCILALIETPGTTLLGIQRILTDKEYRQRILGNVTDPVVKAFWINEFETWRDQFRNEAIVPIQNKVGQFVSTSLIRNIVGQTKSSFDVYDLMNENKILLVNISKGRIGEENSALLGAMIITKIQLAAMERVRIPEDDRQDFYLYVDEFQNFATDAFASILSEARKYRLNLVIAHQYIGQLVDSWMNTKVRDAVFGNVGTMIMFRVGAGDAEFLEKEFEPEFVPQDLVNLPNYQIYLKLMVNGVTSRPFSATTIPPIAATAAMAERDQIVDASRKQYARPVLRVEEDIRRWSSSLPELEGGGAIVAGEALTVPHVVGKEERFETPCWICGKIAQLPFKPDGRRPVYCSDCLHKIEAGELRPLRPLPPEGGREEFEGGLEQFGIAFEGPARHGEPERRPALPAPLASIRRNEPSPSKPIPQRPLRPIAPPQHSEASPRPPMRHDTVPAPRPAFPRVIPHIREGELVARKPVGVGQAIPRVLTLEELKTRATGRASGALRGSLDRASARPEKKETGLADLRQMIQETMKEKQSTPSGAEVLPAQEKKIPSEEPKQNPKNETEKSRPIKPGESIKF